MTERKARQPRNEFERAATKRADEIGHPVEPETRARAEETDSTVEGHFHTSTEDSEEDRSDDAPLYEGQCEGGPMDNMPGQSRFPKGFVVIDQPDSRAWVYDYDPSRNVFVSRKRDVHDRIRHLHAAEGANYDVRAFDRELMRGDMS